MGGMGSGRRWHYGAKDTVEDLRRLDVRRWQRDGLLWDGNAIGWSWTRNGNTMASIRATVGADSVQLIYRSRSRGEEWDDLNYPVALDRTPCNLGGSRPWFLCPAQGCGRRVAVLYGGRIFACRHCYRLAYPSQREDAGDRAARKADRIRERLGWKPGILNGRGWQKPKGMHQTTFDRLRWQHDRFVDQALHGIADKFGFGAELPGL